MRVNAILHHNSHEADYTARAAVTTRFKSQFVLFSIKFGVKRQANSPGDDMISVCLTS